MAWPSQWVSPQRITTLAPVPWVKAASQRQSSATVFGPGYHRGGGVTEPGIVIEEDTDGGVTVVVTLGPESYHKTAARQTSSMSPVPGPTGM